MSLSSEVRRFPRRVVNAIQRRIARTPHEKTAGEVAADFWDESLIHTGPIYWTAHDPVREYVNECITGVKWLWPLVGFKAGWAYRPLSRGLSIGCGTGSLERSVRMLRICERVDAWDISPNSIREAKRAARAEGIDGIRYRAGDCDTREFGREKYDCVFFHGSLHHISDPDTLLQRVALALKPHGILYVDDYVGPSRDEWSEEHLALAREECAGLDPALFMHPLNPPLDSSDPSEMIRSSRIRPAIEENFDVLHYKPYWGNILFPLLCCIDGYALQRPEHAGLLLRWIEREKELVAEGRLVDPLFAVYVGRRKG